MLEQPKEYTYTVYIRNTDIKKDGEWLFSFSFKAKKNEHNQYLIDTDFFDKLLIDNRTYKNIKYKLSVTFINHDSQETEAYSVVLPK